MIKITIIHQFLYACPELENNPILESSWPVLSSIYLISIYRRSSQRDRHDYESQLRETCPCIKQ